MQAANDIAQAVASRVNAENTLTEAKVSEKTVFANALKTGWTQQELNKISPACTTRKRAAKARAANEEPVSHASNN